MSDVPGAWLADEATLNAPLVFEGRNMSPPLKQLLEALMQRDSNRRLGSLEGVCAHPFFSEVEWDLLGKQALPAPFVPNASLVYAKDVVPPLSVHPEDKHSRALDEVGDRLGQWDYAISADTEEWAEELGEYVNKFTPVSSA